MQISLSIQKKKICISYSQDIPDSWRRVAPEAVRAIERRNRVGDFVAVANRGRKEEKRITELFTKCVPI